MPSTKDRKFIYGKVSRRVVILFLIAALIPALVTAILSMNYVNKLLVTNNYKQLHRDSKFFGTSLFERLQTIEKKLQNIGSQIRTGLPASDELQRLVSDQLTALSLVEHDGSITPLFGSSAVIDRLEKTLHRNRSNQRPIISTANTSDSNHHVFIDMALPSATSGNNQHLIAQIRNDYLWSDIDFLSATSTICVIEGKDKILFCSYPAPHVLLQYHDLDTAAHDTPLRWTFNNQDYLAASWEFFLKSHYDAKNWTIITTQLESEALMPVSNFNRVFLLTILVSVLIVSLLSIIQIRRNLTPLTELIEGTRRLANKEFDGTVTIHSRDEFEELASSFNRMTVRLGKQFNALTILSEIDRLILIDPGSERLLAIIINHILEFIECDSVAITVVDHDAEEIGRSFIQYHGIDGNVVDEIQITSISTNDRQKLLAVDNYQHFTVGDELRKFLLPLEKRGARASIVFPVILENRLAAAICLGYLDAPYTLQEDINQIRELGDRLAVALSTAAQDKKLYQQSYYDTLTGLPNRQLFNDRLEQEIIHAHREDHRLALLFIDLDRFKTVNDTLGHTIGDQLLVQVAQQLKACVRESDTVARLGGDEFTVILSSISAPKDASIVADTIIKTLSRPMNISSHELFIGASIGIAIYPEDGTDTEKLLRNADMAMYRAKNKGRNCHLFYEERMNIEEIERARLERELRHALKRKEFSLLYQPLIDLHSGNAIGAEALIRWNHPRYGTLMPSKFITLTEDSGLMESVGEWVLKTACQQYKTWAENGVSLQHLSVNVSSRQFLQDNFVEVVKTTLDEMQIPAEKLELEITESLLMDDRVNTLATLDKLHEMGVLLSIDDFGTGYSSLSYLKRFPINTLKIDRSFLKDVPNDADATTITCSIIGLAHTLKMKVIAEGIESKEQLILLRKHHCDLGQGYYFNQPLTPDEFAEYMLAQNKITHLMPDKGHP